LEGTTRLASVVDSVEYLDDSGVSTDSSDMPDLVKKRTSNPALWKKNVRKEKFNKGLEHQNTRGAVVPAKSLKPPCALNCRQQCREKIRQEQRQELFDSFYQNGNRTRQWDFMAKYIKSSLAIVQRPNTKRHISNAFYLPSGSPAAAVRVCKVFFMNTLDVSHQAITTVLAKLHRSVTIISPDKRGTHVRPVSPTDEERTRIMYEHVNLFPRVPSHYCRANSTKAYLDPTLNVSKMYRLYLEWMTEKENVRPATERQYRDFVKTLEIGIHRPKKDLCNKCTSYDNLSPEERTEEIKLSQDAHIANKTLARAKKNTDKDKSMTDSTFVTATFDFQKVLSAPSGQASLLYYKRKLSIYNFTIYHMGARKGICNVWDESTGKRGANEVASCLLRFMTKEVGLGAREFSFYSDNCSGQNRNRFIYAAYAHFAAQHRVSVTHRFLEPGHTQMEADSVHAQIEKAKQHCKIFTPQQWYGVMASAKKTGHPYEVVEIDRSEIFDLKPFVAQTNWERTVEGKKPKWVSVREIRIEGDSPNIVRFKTDFSQNQYEEIIIYSSDPKPMRGKKKRKQYVYDPRIPLAYQHKLSIGRLKYNDIMSLCVAGIIPKIYHPFYEGLPTVEHDPEEVEENALDGQDEY